MPIELQQRLFADMAGPSEAYVHRGVDERTYFEELRASVRGALCEPYRVRARVMQPAFPFAAEGEVLSGYCVAKRDGYWLVFDPNRETYYAFWGTGEDNLGAHGVFGDPLYCWSA
jgi:hypothetical protein